MLRCRFSTCRRRHASLIPATDKWRVATIIVALLPGYVQTASMTTSPESPRLTSARDLAIRFRELHRPGNPLVIFNAWDAGSARAVAGAGAAAIGTGSWSVAAAHGEDDGEHLDPDAVLATARRIVIATELPVTVDAESGYGAGPDEAAAFVAKLQATGVVGTNLEDSHPGTTSLRGTEEQVARLRAVRAAVGEDFFINARTDVFFTRSGAEAHETLLPEALERAQAYADAGASGIFVPGLSVPSLIGKFAAASPLPVNVMLTGPGVDHRELAGLGVARISYGPYPYLHAMKALEDAARLALS